MPVHTEGFLYVIDRRSNSVIVFGGDADYIEMFVQIRRF